MTSTVHNSNTMSSTADSSKPDRVIAPVLPDAAGVSGLLNTDLDSLAPGEDQMELEVDANMPSTPVRAANKAVKPSSPASDSSGDEDSPSRRPPALVVSPSLVLKVQTGSHLTKKDRLDLIIHRQLPFYMQAVFNHLRKHLTTEGGAEALLAWAYVQDCVDGATVSFKFSISLL